MRILHINPSLSLVRGGPSHSTLEIVRALRKLGIDAEIATTNDNGPGLLEIPLCQRVEYEQLPVWFFPRFSPPITPLREFAFSSQFTNWLWQHISEYDLLHLHCVFSYTCTAAMAIARYRGIPYIVRPNGLLCTWSLQQSTLRKRIYLTLVERANLNQSRAIEFTASQEQKEVASLGLKPESFILPYGLSMPASIPDARSRLREYLGVAVEEPVILFLSRLHHKKGLEYLIPALKLIAEQRFTFVLAGSGDREYEAKIDNLVHTTGIGDRTHKVGFVQGEIKNLLLQGSDIFALTSHSESFGLAILEAIAAGLSIVTTPTVPLASVVEQYQLGYLTQLKVEAISNSLRQCLNDLTDPQKKQQRSDRGRELIFEKYTWDTIGANLIQVYQSILNQKSIPIDIYTKITHTKPVL